MSEITPRQALIVEEIRVISRKTREIVGSKSSGLVWSQLDDKSRSDITVQYRLLIFKAGDTM
jgi:hypothetical protein